MNHQSFVDDVAKKMADRIGHGMREKCLVHAEVVVEVLEADPVGMGFLQLKSAYSNASSSRECSEILRLYTTDYRKFLDAYVPTTSKGTKVKTTAEKIAVIQAFEDGKRVQTKPVNSELHWMDSSNPSWNWVNINYRIKPEPREWWANLFPNGEFGKLYSSKEKVENLNSKKAVGIIHFVGDVLLIIVVSFGLAMVFRNW